MIRSGEYPNLDKICRLCLQTSVNSIEIFDSKSNSESNSVPVRIMACVAVEVRASDSLPKTICENCRFQLEKSYYFRERCKLSDAKLKRHMRLLSAGKKSRIFWSEESDEDEEEFECKESLKFIQEEEAKRELIEKENRKKFEEDMKKEIREQEKQMLLKDLNDFLEQKQLQLNRNNRINQEKGCLLENNKKSTKGTQTLSSFAGQYSDLPRKKLLSNNRKRSSSLMENISSAKKIVVAASSNEISSSEQIQENGSISSVNLKHEDTAEMAEETVVSANEESYYIYNISNGEYLCIDQQANSKYHQEDDVDQGEDEDSGSKMFDIPVTFELAEENNRKDNDENIVESYHIEENDDIQFLKDDDQQQSTIASVNDEESNDISENDLYICRIENPEDESENNETEEMQHEEFISNHEINSENDEQNVNSNIETTSDNNENVESKNSQEVSNLSKDHLSSKSIYTMKRAKVKIFACEKCQQAFTNRASLQRHDKVHEMNREYACALCEKSFSCKSSLDRHTRIHTGEKPFSCDECGKSFIQKEVLKRHQVIHTGDRPFKCPHCPRAFVQKLMLNTHIDIKHLKVPKIKTHDCQLCTKKFNHASGLSRHLLTHTGMTFGCIECGRNFNDKSSVRRHVQSVHRKIEKSDKNKSDDSNDSSSLEKKSEVIELEDEKKPNSIILKFY